MYYHYLDETETADVEQGVCTSAPEPCVWEEVFISTTSLQELEDVAELFL